MSNTKSEKRDVLLHMSNAIKRLMRLLSEDPRYKFDAYVFVESGLTYAQQRLGMGGGPPLEAESLELEASESEGEEPPESDDSPDSDSPDSDSPDMGPPASVPRHVTGQELCEALRLFALDQYGLMAKLVLGTWGIRTTSDFGEIVFNLIRVGRLRKSETDRREDFDNVYDFDEAFCRRFRIEIPEDQDD